MQRLQRCAIISTSCGSIAATTSEQTGFFLIRTARSCQVFRVASSKHSTAHRTSKPGSFAASRAEQILFWCTNALVHDACHEAGLEGTGDIIRNEPVVTVCQSKRVVMKPSDLPFQTLCSFFNVVSEKKKTLKHKNLRHFREKFIERTSDDVFSIYRLMAPAVSFQALLVDLTRRISIIKPRKRLLQ